MPDRREPSPEVLIVEDEPITRMVAADAITDMGSLAREAGDAQEALDVLGTHPKVALLFTDIDMPGTMDGLGLAEKVHEQRPKVEFIVTSGASQMADADLLDDGTFLPKPYGTVRLTELVREKLNR